MCDLSLLAKPATLFHKSCSFDVYQVADSMWIVSDVKMRFGFRTLETQSSSMEQIKKFSKSMCGCVYGRVLNNSGIDETKLAEMFESNGFSILDSVGFFKETGVVDYNTGSEKGIYFKYLPIYN